jgi:hypothetical protein
MDTTLVTVTLLSMGMAGALSVIVWRMLRDERQRSDARVAALATLAAREPDPRMHVERSVPRPAPARRERQPEREMDLPMRASAGRPIDDADGEGGLVHRSLGEGGMFVERREESPWRNRVVVMVGLGLVIASAILFSLTANGRPATRAAAPPVPTAGAQPAQTPAPQAGLELVSLRDSQQAGALTITGLVHNPRGGGLLTRVSVTAYAFDANGAFLASGRALLDVTSLAAGDESPFVVSVPVTETVARYRIGFRGEDGRVIAHVDKRQQGPVAANW